MPQLRVLVVGAGIAGNSITFWLSKLGHAVTVVERFPAPRVTGLQLDVRGHGIDVMRRMGLESAVRAVCVPERGMQLVDTHGTRWGFLPANTSGTGAQSMTSEFEIMRADLCRVLSEETNENADYKYGKTVASVEDDVDGAVKVKFDDGEEAEFDLVVGADGLHSHMRKMVFGSEGLDALHLLDEYCAYCRVPSPLKPGEEYTATAYISPGGRFVLTRRHNAEQLQVYLTSSDISRRLRDVKRGDVVAEKQAIAAEFRGIGWKVDELLDLVMASDDFYCATDGFVALDSWSRGGVTLLGDAAYCSTVNGFGTSCAMIGAYVLAGELARHIKRGETQEAAVLRKNVTDALAEYERKLQPLILDLQEGLGAKSWFDGLGRKAWHLRILYWVAWIVSTSRLYKLVNVVPERGPKWKLPVYEELKL
ncbi:hypothetical protein NLG97_g1498 [Lecanicillium saksenae]|uniref:Uncharacterized protein n=1 Tax=Lecanicillium saksenae TaxID=468837 RepID=A0ACC1R697_9HYPO|nr:hypothetical protein NLG97_g1498 [Lecanicillium saksenae]